MLKEMDVPENINTDSMNYSMDHSQIPPPKLNGDFLNVQQPQQPQKPQQPQQPPINVNNSIMGINLGNSGEMMSKCINLLKSGGIILVLVFIVSLPQVNRSVFTKIPGMLEESGEINIKGVLLKSVICALLFIITSFFL